MNEDTSTAVVFVQCALAINESIKDIDPEDAQSLGSWPIKVPADLSSSEQCSIALDVFHSRVAIGDLERFDIRVTNTEGLELEPLIDENPYSRCDEGTLMSPDD